ncbi:MAG TPA: hypothetical protein DCL44_04805 [Elusimicrobia bacterium]|nr:hypothetical protein [Elusimicrobiota bacterium]
MPGRAEGATAVTVDISAGAGEEGVGAGWVAEEGDSAVSVETALAAGTGAPWAAEKEAEAKGKRRSSKYFFILIGPHENFRLILWAAFHLNTRSQIPDYNSTYNTNFGRSFGKPLSNTLRANDK